MPAYLQKIAIDWDPAKKTTNEFVNDVIAQIERIKRLPPNQQRSELAAGATAVTKRVEALGASGALDPRAAEQALTRAMAPIRAAQEEVSTALVDLGASARAEAASRRLQIVTANEADSAYRKARVEAAATIKKMDQEDRASAARRLEADDDYIAAREADKASEQKSRAKTAEKLAADTVYIEDKASQATSDQELKAKTAEILAVEDKHIAAKVAYARAVALMTAQTDQLLAADDDVIAARVGQANAAQLSRTKVAQELAVDDEVITAKVAYAKAIGLTNAQIAQLLAVDDEVIASKVAVAKANGLIAAQTAQILAADDDVIASRVGQASAAQISRAKVAQELAVDDEVIAAKVAQAKAVGLTNAQTSALLAVDSEVIAAKVAQAKAAGLTAAESSALLAVDDEVIASKVLYAKAIGLTRAQTAELLAADDYVIAAKVMEAKALGLSRAKVASGLAADDEVIASKASLAASNREAALEVRAFNAGIAPRGVAAGGAQAETAEAYEARVVAAERLQADAQRLANAKKLAGMSSEELGVEAETAILEEQRKLALKQVTQSLIQQKVENEEIAAGDAFQRNMWKLGGRKGLPDEGQRAGQFLGGKLATTAGFAVSGAVFYGAYSGLKQIFSSEKDIQQAFTIIQGQLNELGQGGQLANVRRDLAGIAGDTGTAEALIAQVFPQIEGAFHNTSVALEDARTASEIAKITKTDLTATVNSLVPASVAFKVSFRDISDAALGIQERSGVAASRSIELFGALGPVATQYGLSLKEVGAIAASVLQDTTRAPANIAEDLNRMIPQLRSRTPLVHDALQQAGQGKAASEYVKDISDGKTGAALGVLITAYNKLTDAQQQQLEVAAASGRGTKDVIDLVLNYKAAVAELDPQLSNAGKTSKYFSDLQHDLGQEASQVAQQLLNLGRSILESGAADALGDLLRGVALLVHGLGDVAEGFAIADRWTGGFLGRLTEIALAVKGLQLILKSETFAKAKTWTLDHTPGLSRPDGAHYAGSTTKGPEVEFASAVNEAGQTFLGTITTASEKVAAALSGGGGTASAEMGAGGGTAGTALGTGAATANAELGTGGATANAALNTGGTEAAAAMAAGGADAAAAMAAGGAAAGGENIISKALPAAIPAAGAGFLGLGAEVTGASLLGLPGIVAALTGYGAYRGTSTLLGSPDHPNAAGRFEDRALNATLGNVTDLHFGGPKYKSPLDDKSYDQVHGAISDLGYGLQQGAGGALSNDEEKRIAKDLKAAKSKNVDVVLASIKDLNAIYADLKGRDPTAAAAAKEAQTAAGNASELTPDKNGVVHLGDDVDAALAGYANGTDTLIGSITAAQQKLVGLATNDPRVIAAQAKVNKVISDALLQDQQLANSLQNTGAAGDAEKISGEVALFNMPEFNDPGDRLTMAKQIVADLKSQLTAEADAATSTQERNRILAAGLAIPPAVRQALGQQIVDTDPLLQMLLVGTTALDKTIGDQIKKDIANLVAGGMAVGDADVQALQSMLAFLKSAEGVVGATDVDGAALAADIAQVQSDLDAAQKKRDALNTVKGVPDKVTGPPKSNADDLSHQDALNKANADLASARAGNDKVAQARIAQGLAQKDLDAARAAKDDVKIAQALAAKERASQQLAGALNDVALANDNLQAASDADDPIKAAGDAQKIADDQAAMAKQTHDTVGAINAQIAQLSAGRTLAKAMADLGQSQMNLVKAQLDASGDVVGAAKEQVAIIEAQITDFLKQHPGANLGNSAELNNLQAQLVGAQTDVSKTTVSFAEQQIQDNLDLKRITVGQAVEQLRALEAVQTSQQVRDEIEKRVRSLLSSSADLQFNLPTDIVLPTLYEARRLNSTAAGASYQGGTVDNRQQTFIFEGSDLQEVQRVVAGEVGSGSSRFGTTSRRY